MIREKSFEGTTRGEAEQLATDWIKSQRGIRVTNRRAIATGSGTVTKPPTPISPPDRWTIVVEYDDGLN
jgi:hypothetical protein